MARHPWILAAALVAGCGTPASPAHAPAAVAQDTGKASPEASEESPPVPEIVGVNPFTELGPKCKKSVDQLPDGSLPIVTSQDELDKLLGCKAGLTVEWSTEHVVPVSLEGVNKAWSFEGLSTQAGVTTITIEVSTLARGAAFHEKAFWLVRIPASSKSAFIHWTFAAQQKDGFLYP